MTSKGQVDQVDELFTKTVDNWARFYADPKPLTLNSQNLVSRRRFALEMLESHIPPGTKILDIGCGTGHLAGELMNRGYDAWGVDFSAGMVQYAREHYNPERFSAGDIENIKFPDSTFDGVMCLGVVEYLDSDEPALREMWRVLKPGGYAVITTPNSMCPFYYIDRAIETMVGVARPVVRTVRPKPPVDPAKAADLPMVAHRRYNRRRWQQLMRSVGLETVDWVVHSWGCYSLERFWDQGAFCRASDRFARNPMMNWFASNQLALVRAIK